MADKKTNRIHQKLNDDKLFFYLKEKDKAVCEEPAKRESFRCDCEGRYCDGFPTAVNSTLAEKIVDLEKHLKKPVQIISGLRCEERNTEADGSKHSFHLLGRAADIRCAALTVDELAEAAETIGLRVIRDYQDNVVHCQWNG